MATSPMFAEQVRDPGLDVGGVPDTELGDLAVDAHLRRAGQHRDVLDAVVGVQRSARAHRVGADPGGQGDRLAGRAAGDERDGRDAPAAVQPRKPRRPGLSSLLAPRGVRRMWTDRG